MTNPTSNVIRTACWRTIRTTGLALLWAAGGILLHGYAAAGPVPLITQTPASPGIGEPIIYTVVYTNAQAASLDALTITDTISPVIMGVSVSQPAGWLAPAVTSVAGVGTRYVWSNTSVSLPIGETLTFTITGSVGLVCGPTLVGTTAQVDATWGASTSRMITNEVGYVVQPHLTGISVLKQQVPVSPGVGGAVNYTMVVTNTGTATLDSLTVTDTISPVITGVIASQPGGWTAPVVNQLPNGTRYVWSAMGLSFLPGQSLTFTLDGVVGTVTVPTLVSNTAYVIAGSACANGATMMFTNKTNFTLQPPAALDATAALQQSPASPAAGGTVTYLITAANTGSKTIITEMTVTDTVSPVVTVGSTAQPAGFAAPAVTSAAGGSIFVWSATGLILQPGQVTTFTITGTVGAVGVTTQVGNIAQVTAGDGIGIKTALTNQTSFTAYAAAPPAPGLAVTQTMVPASASAGGQVVFRITVVNTGTASLGTLTVIDTLSPVIINAGTAEPSGFGPPTIASIVGTGTRFAWSVAGICLIPGQSLTFTITGTVGTVTASTVVYNSAGAGLVWAGGGVWSVASLLSFTLQPSGPAVKTGEVKITGGIRGYINPKLGEMAAILARPSGAGEITVRIFTLKGALVRTLRQTASGGNQTVVIHWNATDESGAQVPPGAYPVIVEGPGVRYRDTLAVLH